MKHQGECYNLKEIFDRVNTLYFEDKINLEIRWFGSKSFVPRRRILLGSYHRKKGLIKIHRLLDQAHVPHYFITYIMYHEMLHHVEPPIEKLGQRRRIHHSGFKNREKEFQEYALAQEFRKTIRDNWFKPNAVSRPRRKPRRRVRILRRIFNLFV
jgi:hypothetical protein